MNFTDEEIERQRIANERHDLEREADEQRCTAETMQGLVDSERARAEKAEGRVAELEAESSKLLASIVSIDMLADGEAAGYQARVAELEAALREISKLAGEATLTAETLAAFSPLTQIMIRAEEALRATASVSTLPDCTYLGGNEDAAKCNSTRCPRHGARPETPRRRVVIANDPRFAGCRGEEVRRGRVAIVVTVDPENVLSDETSETGGETWADLGPCRVEEGIGLPRTCERGRMWCTAEHRQTANESVAEDDTR